MKKIPLTKGYLATVDDADFEWLTQWKWCACISNSGAVVYAVRGIKRNGKTKLTYMHRVILDADKTLLVDHIDHDGLNNQRHNIRLATAKQNSANNRNFRNKTGFKGVWARHRKFLAKITIDQRDVRLGSFHTAEEAARAYDKAAREAFKEFAKVNF